MATVQSLELVSVGQIRRSECGNRYRVIGMVTPMGSLCRVMVEALDGGRFIGCDPNYVLTLEQVRDMAIVA